MYVIVYCYIDTLTTTTQGHEDMRVLTKLCSMLSDLYVESVLCRIPLQHCYLFY